jgi:hypothetical protein
VRQELDNARIFATRVTAAESGEAEHGVADQIHDHMSSCVALGLCGLADELRAADRVVRVARTSAFAQTVYALRAAALKAPWP